jgi:hypothetical protein
MEQPNDGLIPKRAQALRLNAAPARRRSSFHVCDRHRVLGADHRPWPDPEGPAWRKCGHYARWQEDLELAWKSIWY